MPNTNNKKFWERVAKLYAPFMKSSDGLYEDISQRIRLYLKEDMGVLELACGSGQLSFRLAKRVKLWEATDFSPKMIAEAGKRPHSSRLHFSVQDAASLPYADGTFDAIVIANALHIMPEPEKAMAEIRRVLKSDGLLFAPTFIHGEGARFRLRIRIMGLIGFKTYHKWNAGEFVRFIEKHGFSVKEQAVIGGSLTPLCCLIAEKTDKKYRENLKF